MMCNRNSSRPISHIEEMDDVCAYGGIELVNFVCKICQSIASISRVKLGTWGIETMHMHRDPNIHVQAQAQYRHKITENNEQTSSDHASMILSKPHNLTRI